MRPAQLTLVLERSVKRAQLWAKAKHQPHYFVAFLALCPDDLPADPKRLVPPYLVHGAAAGDPWGQHFVRCCSPSGQSFMRACAMLLEKPPAPEAVYLLLDILGRYFYGAEAQTIQVDWSEELQREARAVACLGRLNHADARPILNKTTAVGPLMRGHLEPLFGPVLVKLQQLRGQP